VCSRLFMLMGVVILSCFFVYNTFAADIETLLKDGKAAIENGRYEEAVSRLGELLTASGDKTNDPKIVAFGSTVQAYGVWKMNNPQMIPMVIQYLNKAISADPTWKYPEKLLKKVEGKK
jgi:hypothetical protein